MGKITLNQPVQRVAVLRNALTPDQVNNRQAEFVISTEAADDYNTVFKLSGWNLARYSANPIVGFNHKVLDDNPDNVIGNSEVFIEGNQLIGRVTFESAEINPKAEKVFQKVQSGTLRMASIWAVPTRGHWGDKKLGEDPDMVYFDEQELYEWSVVTVGSNPEALKRNSEFMAALSDNLIKNIEVAGIDPVNTEKRSMRERQLLINKNR